MFALAFTISDIIAFQICHCCEPPLLTLTRTARAKRRCRQWQGAALSPAGVRILHMHMSGATDGGVDLITA